MSIMDKARNAAQKAAGEVKQVVGRQSGDRRLEAEGRKDQVAGDLKNAGEKVKDAVK
jgi:uncharacterized protein YjbJ (UPF0337 family)